MAMEVEDVQLACANCDTAFEKGADQVTKFHVTIDETPYNHKDVSILEAVATVCRAKSSKLATYSKMVMCARCATVVADLYRSFVELMQLSKSTAYIAKVLVQADIWHRSRQAATAGSGTIVNTEEGPVTEDSEYNQDFLASMLAVELTEGISDDDACDSDHQDAETDKTKNLDGNSSDHFRKIVPKKRKITGGTGSLSPNNRSRRKTTLPLKILSNEMSLSSTPDQKQESNLRRSDRRRVPSVTQIAEIKLKIEKEQDSSDISEDGGKETEVQIKKRKKGTSRFAKGKLGRRRRRNTPLPIDANNGEEGDSDAKMNNKRMKTTSASKIECPSCEKTFSYFWMLEQHVQLVHENNKPRTCSECGFQYFNFRMFEVHHCIPKESKELEKLERPFRCKFCGKTLISQGHFSAHCSSHDVDEDKRYKCPYPDCKLTFKFPKNLVKHEKTHLEEKSWQCSVCGKVFRVKRNLTIHMEIHKEEKKYLCPTCGERFAQRRGLFRHLNTHGSNLKHKCPICGKGFKRKDHVTQHLSSKVHPKIQMDPIQIKETHEEAGDNSSIQLIAFDADPSTLHSVEILQQSSPHEDSDSEHKILQHRQPHQTIHQAHSFMSNPGTAVIIQHSAEFAFSDLLTL